jgi:alkylhydroperoxidase family enzyme
MSHTSSTNPFELHEGAAESWAFIERHVLEGGLVDPALKQLCFAYVADPDAVDVGRREGRERAALEWAHAIVWDADAATDELWERLHALFGEPELVELGCAIGFELGRTHFLHSLGADPGARAATVRS